MLPNFHDYVMRHGEHAVQIIIEQIERNEGIRSRHDISLEQRWMALATNCANDDYQQIAA